MARLLSSLEKGSPGVVAPGQMEKLFHGVEKVSTPRLRVIFGYFCVQEAYDRSVLI